MSQETLFQESQALYAAYFFAADAACECYAAERSTSFNDPSREAEKEVKVSHGCCG